MSDKRIYELTEASVVGADDFLALDSSEFSETKKIKTSTLTNGLVFKESLTNLIINSDTNNTGSTITKGTVFYLYGELCIALVDIASGAEFTPSTNYDNITVGGQITEIKSALSKVNSDIDYQKNYYSIKDYYNIGSSTSKWDVTKATELMTDLLDWVGSLKFCYGLIQVINGTRYVGTYTYRYDESSQKAYIVVNITSYFQDHSYTIIKNADTITVDDNLTSNNIANNLTTTSAGKVLDARQGKELSEGLVHFIVVTKTVTTAAGSDYWSLVVPAKSGYRRVVLEINTGSPVIVKGYSMSGDNMTVYIYNMSDSPVEITITATVGYFNQSLQDT